MKIRIFDTPEELAYQSAHWIADKIIAAVKERGTCSLVLSGGNTPKRVYEILAANPFQKNIPWASVHFFWGDERMVPYDDEQNNAAMAFKSLLNHIKVPAQHIHRMPSEAAPAQAEEQYSELLHHHFKSTDPFSFDIVLLGMGDDGHTLSLFPNTKFPADEKQWVYCYYAEKMKQYRITLLPSIINKCRSACFIVSGASKEPAFKQVTNGEKNEMAFPSQLIRPVNGELYWFIDSAVKGTH